jgi:signal transduction histidine kinase
MPGPILEAPVQEALQHYIKTIVGAAIRHDFRVPLSLIGRKIGSSRDLIKRHSHIAAVLKNPNKYFQLLLEVEQENARAYAILSELGPSIESDPRGDLEHLAERITVEIRPGLKALRKQCALLLSEAPDDEKLHTRARDAHAAADRMENMLTGLLTVVDIGRARALSFHPVHLNALASRIARTVRHFEPSANIREIPVHGEATIMGVESQLILLIQNLIQNAVKFTKHLPHPIVEVTIMSNAFSGLKTKYEEFLDGYSAPGDWVEFSVVDNGPGIPSGDHSAIFNLYHSKDPTDRRKRGSGVGLAVAKLITTIHRGVIFATYPDRGAKLVVMLPILPMYGLSFDSLLQRELARPARGKKQQLT